MNHVHDFSGYLPSITLPLGIVIPTYFLIVSLAFSMSLIWLVRRAEARALSRNLSLDLAMIVMGFGFLGARLFHILFEEPAYYWESWSRVYEIWRGGFVWFGGALLAAVGVGLYMRRRFMPIGVWLDVFAPLCAFGYALGRLACVLAGCCYGATCTLSSGYTFRYPTQIFASTWEFAVLFILLLIERRRRFLGPWFKRDGQLFVIWLGLHSIGRIIMESFRADPRGPEPLGLSVSTWISLVLLIAAIRFSARVRWPLRS